MENIRKLYKNIKFKISDPTWNEEFELSDGSCSVSDIQEYSEYILNNIEKRLMVTIIIQQKYIKINYKIEFRLK